MAASLKIALTIFLAVFVFHKYSIDAQVDLANVQQTCNRLRQFHAQNPANHAIIAIANNMTGSIHDQLEADVPPFTGRELNPNDIVGTIPRDNVNRLCTQLFALIQANPNNPAIFHCANNATENFFRFLTTPPAPVPVPAPQNNVPHQNHGNHPPGPQGNAGNAHGGQGHH